MKIIDAHCHIYPPAIAAKAVNNIGKFYDIEMSRLGTLEDLLAVGEKAHISHYLIFSVATTPHQSKSINEFISRSVRENAPIMSGLGTLHPDSSDILADIEHLCDLGLLGVKLHHDFQAVYADDAKCMKIYEICAAKNLPVLLHTGDNRYDYSNPNRIKNILTTFPDLTVIGAHFGGWSIWKQAAHELADYPNFFVDSSSSFYALKPQEAREIIRIYGSDRVMFASDFPMWEALDDLNYLSKLDLTEAELENILHGTCEKVFNLNV